MSEAVYFLCGISRPVNSPNAIMKHAHIYAGLAAATSEYAASMQSLTSELTAHNRGPTTDAMTQRMQGPGSSSDQLAQISEGASSTSVALAEAAGILWGCQLAMDTLTIRTQEAAAAALKTPFDAPAKLSALYRQATRELRALERQTVAYIQTALGTAWVPGEIDVGSQRPDEALSPEVQGYWRSLPDDERLRIIENIIAKRAREHGIVPPPPIRYYDKNSEPERTHWLGYWDGQTLNINRDFLEEPVTINVAVHEMGHAVRSHSMQKYESYSSQDIEDMILEKRPDIFTQYGYTAEEMRRLNEAEVHYENHGPYNGRAPAEIDAGRHVYEWSDHLTVEQLERYR